MMQDHFPDPSGALIDVGNDKPEYLFRLIHGMDIFNQGMDGNLFIAMDYPIRCFHDDVPRVSEDRLPAFQNGSGAKQAVAHWVNTACRFTWQPEFLHCLQITATESGIKGLFGFARCGEFNRSHGSIEASAGFR